MNIVFNLISLLTIAFFVTTNTYSFVEKNHLSAEGFWLQYSDQSSGKAQSVIQIYRDKNGTISGKIAVPFFKLEKKHVVVPDISCAHHCGKGSTNGYTYDYTTMPASQVEGLKIIWGLIESKPVATKGPITYSDGSILDPVSGRVYSCKAKLKKNGTILKATGYIFIPWFGRTQTWKRIDDSTAKKLISKCGLTLKGFYPYTDEKGKINDEALWKFCSHVN